MPTAKKTIKIIKLQPIEKIKAINPVIIVNTKGEEKPYYSIMYYDVSDNTWHIGYSSYELSYVRQWLAEYFEPIEAEVRPVKYGHWKNGICPECGYEDCIEPSYCLSCGAKMEGGEDIS